MPEDAPDLLDRIRQSVQDARTKTGEIDEMMAELRALQSSQGVSIAVLDLLQCLAVESALHKALQANSERLLRATEQLRRDRDERGF